MSELKFACPACGQHLQCDLAMAGKQMQCPNCQVPFLAPALPAGAPPPAPTAHAAPPPPPPGMHKAPPPPPPGHGAPPPPPPPGLTVAPSGGKPGAPTPAPVFTSVNKAPQGGTKKKTQPLAIVSLVCGLLPFLFPVGIVCGHMARAKIRKDPSLGGKGMAMAGLILSYLSLAGVVACVAALMMGLSFLKKLSEESAKAGAGTNQVAGASANGEAPAVREHKKGASRPGPSTPEEAARAFIEASKKGDVKATLGLMTQKAQGIIGGALGTNLPPTMPAVPNTPGAPAIEYNVGEVTTNADVATVQLHIAAGAIKQPMQLKMRQENGSWRIFGEALFADEKQPGLLLDFENLPDQATLRAQLAAVMAKQMGAAGGGEQSLEPFTKDQFDALGKLDLEAMGQPAIEVLTPLAKGLGLALTQNAKQETQLNKPVTFKGGKAPLEIIEDIGRQIERVPAYSGLRLTFRRDTRVNPVAFAGPLMLEVESAESSATGAGQLKLALRGYGLPVPLANLLREQGSVILSVTSIGDGQKDYADRSGRITLAADRSPGALVASVVVPLTGMDGGVAKIPVARLKATLTLPSAVEKIEFARLEAGASEKAGSVQVTLTKITGASYQFEIVGAPAGRVQFSAHNDQGATLKATSNVTSAAPEKSTVNVLVTGKPRSLTAHVATTVAETPVEFELHDIPVKGGAAPAATVAAPATVAKAPTTTTPGAPAPAAKAPAGTGAVNLFKDARPVASSTAEATELVVTSVNDGNVKTRWNSNNNDAKGAWVGGRWEDPVTINRVVIHQAFDRITGFRVQKLDEEKDEWVDVTVVEGPAFAQVKGRIAPGKNPMDSTVNPVFNVNLPAPVTTRGLRMLVTDVSKFVYSISVSELEAY